MLTFLDTFTLRLAAAAWLRTAPDSLETAFAAHLRLVDIHPFNDGNGRTARLPMNLILLCLQHAYNALLYKRLDETLAEYITALSEMRR